MDFAFHFGLGGYVPHLLYFGAIVAFLLSCCWRPQVGLYYLIPLLPLQELRDRVNDLPWGQHLVPFVMLGVSIGVLFRAKGQVLPKNPMNRLSVVWILLCYLSLWSGSFFLGTDLPLSVFDPRFAAWKDYMLMPLLFFLVVCVIKDKRQIKTVVLLMCLSAFAVFRGFFLTVSGRDFSHFTENLRIGTELGYAGYNGLGAFEAQFGLFLLGLYAFEKKRLLKFALLATILACGYCLLFVFSRGAYIAFMVGLIFLGLFKERKLLLLAAAILIGWQTLLPVSVQERIKMTYQQGELDPSVGARLTLWEEAQSLVVSNPVLGSGFDTYRFLNHSSGLGDTHNYYLKVLVEMGAVGLLSYLLLLAKAFRLGHTLFRSAQDPFLKGFGLGFAALMVGAVVLNLFGDRWTLLQVNGFLWTLMGCVVGGQLLTEKGELDAEETRGHVSVLAPATDHESRTARALPTNSNSRGGSRWFAGSRQDAQVKTIVEITGNTRSAGGISLVPKPTGSFSPSASGSHLADRTHVLFLIDQLCGIGGAERTLLNIIRLLPKDRFRCTVVTFKIDPRWHVFENFPCPWSLFPLRRTYDWNALQVALRLRRLIRTQQVRIVHTFFESSDLWGGLIAKLSGTPVLISSRRDMGILRTSKHQLAYRVLSPLFDLVLAVSDEVRAFCIRQDHLDPEKVLTLYNGVEIEKVTVTTDVAALRASKDLCGASHLVSTVGHIREVKSLDVLIRAAAKVCQQFPRAMFLVIGDVLERHHFQELLELTESLGLRQNVRFLGLAEDVFSLLKMSDVFCLPSRSEGFSNVLLEAMACGLPCVATRVGGNAEALEDGRSGFLIESEDPDALADRILTLLRQPGLAKEMGREGRRVVEAKFTIQAMMSRLANLYDNLLMAKRV